MNPNQMNDEMKRNLTLHDTGMTAISQVSPELGRIGDLAQSDASSQKGNRPGIDDRKTNQSQAARHIGIDLASNSAHVIGPDLENEDSQTLTILINSDKKGVYDETLTVAGKPTSIITSRATTPQESPQSENYQNLFNPVTLSGIQYLKRRGLASAFSACPRVSHPPSDEASSRFYIADFKCKDEEGKMSRSTPMAQNV